MASVFYLYFFTGLTVYSGLLIARACSGKGIHLPLFELVLTYIFYGVVWPVIVFYSLPRNGLHSLFESNSSLPSLQDTEKEFELLWDNPPACSNNIYIHGYDESKYEPLNSRLYFSAAEAQEYLRQKILPDSDNYLDWEALILRWLEQRNTLDNKVCEVPESLSHFYAVSNQLLEEGKGLIFCSECNKYFRAAELPAVPQTLTIGWNYSRIYCPARHLLSASKSLHINM
ncbi:hypothetical protein [Salinimonas lutimaris]|uniref:hypothetical protein n=1 Tax=Salinimonas lutimaris TaxID=914153 RepID=UPI0010BFCE00|nr:hypothetical protein [Salinimonas lutimaris]